MGLMHDGGDNIIKLLGIVVITVIFMLSLGSYVDDHDSARLEGCRDSAEALCDSYGMELNGLYHTPIMDTMVQCRSDHELKEFEVYCPD